MLWTLFLLHMKHRFLLLALLPLLSACHHETRPDNVLSHDQMVRFLTEACRIEGRNAVSSHYRFDVLSNEAVISYDSLLRAMGVEQQQVDTSLAYYSAHLDEYQPILDSVAAVFEE